MSQRLLAVIAAFGGIDAALLIIVGAQMWNGSYVPAEVAVGKALVTIGAAVAIPAFVALLAYLDSRTAPAATGQPTKGYDTDF